MDKFLLFGSTGYIGGEFKRQLGDAVIAAPSYSCLRYIDDVRNIIKHFNPTVVINAAGYTGKPNVDACEDHREECFRGNVVFPLWIAQACADLNIPFGHVSSGCIYNGYEKIYTEQDEPDFSFIQQNCSYYSGTKAECERELRAFPNAWVWRLRIPFDHYNNPRNYLTKMLNYSKILNLPNSVSHRAEYVAACIATIKQRTTPGVYNVTNPGSITASRLFELMLQHRPELESVITNKSYFASVEEFMKHARAPRSNCVLDASKLAATGITMTPVEDIIVDCIKKYEL